MWSLTTGWQSFKTYRESIEYQYYSNQMLFGDFDGDYTSTEYVEDYDKLKFRYNLAKKLQSTKSLRHLYDYEKEHKNSVWTLVKRRLSFDEEDTLKKEYIPIVVSKIKIELKNKIDLNLDDEINIESLIEATKDKEPSVREKVLTLIYFMTFISRIKGANMNRLSKILNVTYPSMDSIMSNYPLNFPVKCRCCGTINKIKGINKRFELSVTKCSCGHYAAGTCVRCECDYCKDALKQFDKKPYIENIISEMISLLDTGEIGVGCIHRKSDIIEEKESDYIINSIAVNRGVETLIKLNPKNNEELFRYIEKIAESGHYEEKNAREFIETLLKLKILYRVFDVEGLKSVLPDKVNNIVTYRLSELADWYSYGWGDECRVDVSEYFMHLVEDKINISYEVNEFYFNGFGCK